MNRHQRRAEAAKTRGKRHLPVVFNFDGSNMTPEGLQAAQAMMDLSDRAGRAVYETASSFFENRDTSVDSVLEMARLTNLLAQELVAKADSGETKGIPVACARGCHFCCSLMVTTTVPEILLLLDRIDSYSPEKRDELYQRVVAVDDRVRGLSAQQRAGAAVLCPLLEDGECSVYDIRPVACVGYNSVSLQRCEEAFGQTTAPIPSRSDHIAYGHATREGTGHALSDHGLYGKYVELVHALRIALEQPMAAAKYVRAEPLFEPAEIPDFQ